MEHELPLRLGFFLGLFVLFAIAEAYAPRRPRALPRQGRWLTNWAFVLIDTAALRLLALALPLLAVGAAADAARQGWGLFNLTGLPGWVEALLAILILDLAIWAQHLITHKVPLFWRFHRVHHADRDMDVTSSLSRRRLRSSPAPRRAFSRTGLKDFVRKSSAPSSMARTASSISSSEEMTITGMSRSLGSALIAVRTSKPSISGMTISSRTMSKRPSLSRVRPSAPLATVSTSWPRF